MEKATKRRIILMVQIVIAVFVAAGAVWLAFKAVGYHQAQQVYRDMETAYADELGSGDDATCPVDFASLKQQYPDVVGWLKMDDVDLSYVIVQGEDNDHYLHYDPAGNESIDGAIFLDYRNKSLDDDRYSILYGHNMLDETMFGSLDNYVNEQFYRNGKGTFTIYTPNGAYVYKIFAAAIVDPTDETYAMGFKDTATFGAFVQRIEDKSMYPTGVEASGTDHIVSLSTCSDSDRLVLSAKRVSEQSWKA